MRLTEGADGTLSWNFGEAPEVKPLHRTLRTVYFGPDEDRSSLFEKQLELAKFAGVQKGTVSKHLKALRREGLMMVEVLDVTDAGIERLQQLFPDDDFDT